VTIAVAVGAAALALGALALLALRLVSTADFRLAEQIRSASQPLRRRRKRRREGMMEDRPAEPLDPYGESPPPTGDDDPPSEGEPLPGEPKDDKLESDSADAAERSNAVKIARSATPEQGDQNENYAHVGEQVASVLAAAHQAADQIRATALEEAEQIREEANADAAATRDQAGRAAEQARRESEALRAEADEYSTEAHEAADRYVATTRQQVEDEAARRRAEIDREARESHRAAEQQARGIETEALERRRAIIEEAERSEARLEQLLGVFRGMTSQLEELLRPEPVADDAEAPDESVADEFAQDLRPQRSRTEPATGSRPRT
jgi:hypothetical protein